MKERDLNLDLIKVVAMFSVIGLHTCHTYMSNIMADIIYKSSVCDRYHISICGICGTSLIFLICLSDKCYNFICYYENS